MRTLRDFIPTKEQVEKMRKDKSYLRSPKFLRDSADFDDAMEYLKSLEKMPQKDKKSELGQN